MANKAISLEQMSRIWGKVKSYVASAISGLYTKPSGGIPKSDLSSEVQTSLGKADSALQSFTESDPTVPSWAKQSRKPTYTASEVGALPDSTTIPTKTSDLTNDSGFLTQHQSIKTIGGNTITGSGNIPWPTYTANDTGALPNTTTLADLEDATHKTVTPTEKATWNDYGQQIEDIVEDIEGAASSETDITSTLTINQGYVERNGTVTAYNSWQYSSPILLHKGDTVTWNISNSGSYPTLAIAESDSVVIGDVLTVMSTISTASYTAAGNTYVVFSGNRIISVSLRTAGGLKSDIESLESRVAALEARLA